SRARFARDLGAWRETAVTTLLVQGDATAVTTLAPLLAQPSGGAGGAGWRGAARALASVGPGPVGAGEPDGAAQVDPAPVARQRAALGAQLGERGVEVVRGRRPRRVDDAPPRDGGAVVVQDRKS